MHWKEKLKGLEAARDLIQEEINRLRKPKIVIAGNFWQWLEYQKKYPDDNLVEASSIERICGIEASEIVYWGCYWLREDFPQIARVAKSRVR